MFPSLTRLGRGSKQRQKRRYIFSYSCSSLSFLILKFYSFFIRYQELFS